MQCKEIIQVIEATFPRTAALGFDNVGLLAGRSEKEVSRIYLALDCNRCCDRPCDQGRCGHADHTSPAFILSSKESDG